MQKISPDSPGKQRTNVFAPKGQLVASKKKKKDLDFMTDCGLEDCKSQEFHMLLDPDADNKNKQKQMKDLKSIEKSMNFLEIDG